jgi:tRNA A-37 threonylcarbamoyl transferase component Bud32
MDKGHDGPLLEVAKAISDGAPVDWDRQSAAHEELKPELGRMRLLEAVAAAHRAQAVEERGARIGSAAIGASPTGLSTISSTPSKSPPAITQWGPLEIIDMLGRGGFGEVYRAHDPTLQRKVALKLRRPDKQGIDHGSSRFVDEARRLARVRHPNVLVVHGADMHEGRVGLWTDLLEGKTLEECLAEQGPFSAHEAALVGIDLCRALAAVHAAGLVHRDVKTSNVMREKGGRIVLMDFGSVSEAPGVDGQVTDSEISGTPQFMAPEVLLNGQIARPAADIYGLGVLLYRLVSGRFPIEAGNLTELRAKVARGAFLPLTDARPDLPGAFVRTVERSLEIDPSRRFASAGAMERALADAIGSPEPYAEPVPSPAPRALWTRPWSWALAAAGVMLAVVVVMLLSSLGAAFTVEAALLRQAQHGDERLADGATLSAGDRLFMEVRGSIALHVYILNEDRAGNVFVLFPAGLDLSNPLPPQILHRLPGVLVGQQQYWQVTSSEGAESILVVASRRPLPDLEREIAGFPHAESGRAVTGRQMNPQAVARLTRGIGGMVGADSGAAGGSQGALSRLARTLPQRSESAGDVWIRLFQLENPAP